VLDKILY